ncbi:hypothetical protein PPSIR1_41814 [Plesiocystis pacifica SIR-1]|uniref:Mannose-6-phosphate isomerase n=1 Tax=Plesiocystis pacifica SIR-1 TaxID=391625 RepID=A6G0V4_9BACT|nr:hypothetical protein [Plesiocystis pacifica]EDM80492.1 hypothetical protein PPSIR1_41814 [Plesiocystis pacifica SIR-1]
MSDSPLDERLRAGEPAVVNLVSAAPLRLRRDNLVERPWAGRQMARYKDLEPRSGGDGPRYGEVFEVAADPLDPEAARHPSVVELADGTAVDLLHLLEFAGEWILGPAMLEAFGRRIPLLPKTLDVGALLSVQTHPPGNPELYVVIEREPGATLCLGFAEGVEGQALAEELEAGRRGQVALRALLRPEVDEHALQRAIADHLRSEDARAGRHGALVEALAPWVAEPSEAGRGQLSTLVGELVDLVLRTLGRLNAIPVEPGQILYNADPPTPRSAETPSAQVHALGNLEGRSLLVLEIRRPGPTFRAWDHLRFPMRPIDVGAAIATMNTEASDPASFVVETIVERPGVHRSVACPAFIVDHLRPCAEQPVVEAAFPGQLTTLHAIRGRVELSGPNQESWGELRAGESMLVPAGVQGLSVRQSQGDEGGEACEVVQVILPVDPRDGLRTNLAQLRSLAPRNLGPRQVLAVVNGGDGPAMTEHFSAQAEAVFRADGSTEIYAHEEPRRRGQFLGLLDALASFAARHPGGIDADGVALGIMLPGRGTRSSPLTQRLHGIKPLLPVPVSVTGVGAGERRWLDAATASVWTWTLVVRTLERLGFRGIALKWGDEPQMSAKALAALSAARRDLSEVDAVRFGSHTRITEDLARNKEWLRVDERGELVVQVHRRPRAELLSALGLEDGAGEDALARAHVHTGSPAFSHVFLRHAAEAFAGVEAWIDVDGYLFEALTQDAATWAAEVERDPRLQALVARCPDFYARARDLRARVEAERGHPMRVAVIDMGEAPYWGDVGQVAKARDAYLALRDDPFAQALAALDFGQPDRWGNRAVGDCELPQDGSVRDCLIVDSALGSGQAEGAVIVGSRLDHFAIAAGSVVLDARVRGLRLDAGAFAFRSRGDYLRVPAEHVHTSIPRDPLAVVDAETVELDSWFADMRVNPGAAEFYDEPRWGNPGSFAEKFAQVRQREVSPAAIEARLRAEP